MPQAGSSRRVKFTASKLSSFAKVNHCEYNTPSHRSLSDGMVKAMASRLEIELDDGETRVMKSTSNDKPTKLHTNTQTKPTGSTEPQYKMMSPTPIQKIGESILAGTQVAEEPPPKPRTPIQPSDPSFLSMAAGNTRTTGPKTILLQGPSECGRSSLAMEFAMEMASKATCCCSPAQQQQPCVCRPVALLRPDTTDDSFPIPCRRFGKQQQQQSTKNLNRFKSGDDNNNDKLWNQSILERIQVYHFGSFRDTLLYLLSLQGKPLQEQPYSAIVIDDLDSLAENSATTTANESAMQMSQFLALVFDTLRFLKTRPHLCVTVHSNCQFPLDCFMASFFDTILTTSRSKSSDQQQIQQQQQNKQQPNWTNAYCQENNVILHTTWSVTAKHKDKSQNHDQEADQDQKQLGWIIAHSGGGNYQLLWRAIRYD